MQSFFCIDKKKQIALINAAKKKQTTALHVDNENTTKEVSSEAMIALGEAAEPIIHFDQTSRAL